MNGKCKLYDEESDLKESHIIPKFIIDYFKSTGSRFLRYFAFPNQRKQDGIKRNYLSQRAELDFSKKEKWFAENIFKPFLEDNQSSFVYDGDLYFFLISLLWRGLLHQLELPEISNNPNLKILLKVEQEWKHFLSGKDQVKDFSDVNLFLSDEIAEHNTGIPGLDYYFTRTIDFTILSDDSGQCIYVYCKFLRFIIWATVRDVHPNINTELIIKKEGGTINFPQKINDAYIIQSLLERIKIIESLPGPSEAQLNKIFEEIARNPDTLFKSSAGRAILNDFRLDKK